MKKTKVKDELKQLDINELKVKLNSVRNELFNIKFNASRAHIEDSSQFKKLRRNIAQVLTYLRQKS